MIIMTVEMRITASTARPMINPRGGSTNFEIFQYLDFVTN
jgi:hypothetical protein